MPEFEPRSQPNFQRSQPGELPGLGGGQLVDRNADADVGPMSLKGLASGQKARSAARVIAAAIAVVASFVVSQTAKNEQVLLVFFEQGQGRGQIQRLAAFGRRRPLLHVHAVGHKPEGQSIGRCGTDRGPGSSREHAIEKWQGDQRTQSFECRADRGMRCRSSLIRWLLSLAAIETVRFVRSPTPTARTGRHRPPAPCRLCRSPGDQTARCRVQSHRLTSFRPDNS